MVLLHGMEYGALPRRDTNDADALVDVRVAPRGSVNLAAALTEMDWSSKTFIPMASVTGYVNLLHHRRTMRPSRARLWFDVVRSCHTA